MFKKLFNRKPEDKSAEETSGSLQPGDIIFSTGSNEFYKAIRELSPEMMEQMERSTLPVMTTQLYMHYWSDGLNDDNQNDPAWHNQAIFFWRAEEPFPKKIVTG